jgi:DNA-binding response OmpR family regulator
MLTARHSIDDKAQGFLAGTDDYLVKPFSMQELVMRLTALSQRANRSDKRTLGKLQLEVSRNKALILGNEISLTPDEWRLLLLLSRENKTVAREKIFDQLWPDGIGTDDGLKMLLFRLRKTISLTLDLAQLPDDTLQIKTVRGIGLRLECGE